MPRRFTEDEEHRIRAALRDSARAIMGLRGVRKTGIDEAGISQWYNPAL
ncbi:MAG: hypothetical protein ACOCRN_00345 [Spirochaetia bacterium]